MKQINPYTIDFSNDQSVLAISNTSGGGHATANEAVKHQFNSQKTATHLKNFGYQTVDIIKNSFPPYIGTIMQKAFSSGWNRAKAQGDIKKQVKLITGRPFLIGPTTQRIADIFLFIPVFIATLIRLACNRKITRIVDTQPLATSAIIKAARLVNYFTKRTVIVSKVMTDLPTKDAIHYFAPIKKLSNNDKKILELISTNPLREGDDKALTEKEWWNKYFGLEFDSHNEKNSQIKYRDFPLRAAFAQWKNRPVEGSHPEIQVKINNKEEFQFINELMDRKLKQTNATHNGMTKIKNIVRIPIEDTDIVGIVTIGSQAAKGTKDYIQSFLDLVIDLDKSDKIKTNYYFFLQSGKHTPRSKSTLFYQIYSKLKNTALPPTLKNKLHIVPMGFQDDEELAALYHRADFGIYNGGGLTTMEVNYGARGAIFLHSEKKLANEKLDGNFNEIEEGLTEGFALWEKGNVRFQKNNKGATIISPQVFKKAVYDIIKKKR